MTTVEINGEALKVKVEAPGVALAEAAETALRLHRRVCAGIAARERSDEKRGTLRVVSLTKTGFGFAQTAEEPAEDDDDEE